tara:strand:+ start:50 stop:310 length:261 start_codon:yes stop_codon:yes gene_type:complete
MTKKHFQAVANDFKYRAQVIYEGEYSTYEEKWFALSTLNATAYDLSRTFQKFNPNFNQGLFIEACEVGAYKLELERERASYIATGL